MKERYELKPEDLTYTLPDDLIPEETTDDIKVLEEFIGQERAKKALEVGLSLKGYGYNIYAAGPPGTGKRTMVLEYLRRIAKGMPPPYDWCYVNNFENPIVPKALWFPKGLGRKFKEDVNEFIKHIKDAITKSFESQRYLSEREEIIRTYMDKQIEKEKEFQRKAHERGFIVSFTSKGPIISPHIQGKPISPQEFEHLPEEFKQKIMEEKERLDKEILNLIFELRQIEREKNEKLKEFDKETVNYSISTLFQELVEKYKDLDHVVDYLHQMKEDILKNYELFKPQQKPPIPMPFPIPVQQDQLTRRYQVNLIVDNSGTEGAPVIYEVVPNYVNLVGRIEKEVQMGALYTDFSMIHAGSLHLANGGFLMMEFEELLRYPYAYHALKKALKTGMIITEDIGETLGIVTTKTLKPEPIPLNVKVILTGPLFLYHLAYELDEDFRELFRIRAEFHTDMEKNHENLQKYKSFIATVVRRENLLPFSREAIKSIIQYSSRIVEDKTKLSTQFFEIVDLIKESDFWARRASSNIVQKEHVEKALDEKKYRISFLEEKIMELIQRGFLVVDTTGRKLGVINGLAVLTFGDINFGRPVRITATVSPGKGGLLDIEREVGLGGKIHSKGFMILSGFLYEIFGKYEPLNLNARIAFEQSYSEIEGDSASSAELYALLSAIANVPLRQDIAVTGSVNQKGEIQPVGGINEKIEGFYRICKIRGLTGTQGVIIPKRNLDNLMLHREVIESVREGKFHIYSVENIMEGMEILTGMPFGLREDGKIEEDSLAWKVLERLREFKKFVEGEKEKKGKRRKED